MKTFIILALAVIATQAAVIDSPDVVKVQAPEIPEIAPDAAPSASGLVGRNFIVGTTAGYRQLYSVFVSRNAVANQIQVQDVVYTTTNPNIRIWGAQALFLTNQGATVRVVAGGVGQNTMTLRITSARGRGFWYQVSFWGI